MPTITQRIAGLDLDPEVARTLLQVSSDDAARLATLSHLAPLFPALGAALGHDDPASVAASGRPGCCCTRRFRGSIISKMMTR
ncbi:hypothetical protein HC891_25015 [Candidatus Gracilibacteria bacterium]|nr:hypothetical protein [Candidatus Gracilibacteria bacterium]